MKVNLGYYGLNLYSLMINYFYNLKPNFKL